MNHPIEKIPRVLYHRKIHLELNLDGTTINIVRIGIAISRTLGQFALLASTFVLGNDRFKPRPFDFKLTPKLLQC